MAWWKPLLAGLAHSAAMLLAAPPLGLWPAALLSILPLVIVGCCRSARPWRDTGLVFVGAASIVIGPLAHRMLHRMHADRL